MERLQGIVCRAPQQVSQQGSWEGVNVRGGAKLGRERAERAGVASGWVDLVVIVHARSYPI